MRLKIACLGLALWATGACAETALESSEVLLLAGGALPLCTSTTPAQCRSLAPKGRRSTPETFITDETGQRLREVVNFDASKSAASKAIYLHFVAMARAAHQVRTGKRIARPKIAFLTSASIDPYDAVDFYQSAFEQTGADAVWLPLDGAVREAFGARCARIGQIRSRITLATDRSAIYPDLANIQRQFCQDRSRLLAILSEADGLFFNGGDQSLSKRAWFDADQPIPEFALIQKRLRLAQLAIGGTSAGTAVMSSGVMITNGLSEVALKRGAKAVPAPQLGCGEKNTCPPGLLEDDLTYDAKGGLALFPLGILDTHFAARDRHGRLAQLLIDSQTRFGFGVDETTALVVGRTMQGWRLRTLGEGVVWIFDAKASTNASKLARQARQLKPNETLEWPLK